MLKYTKHYNLVLALILYLQLSLFNMIIKKFDLSKNEVASYIYSIHPHTQSHSRHAFHPHCHYGLPYNRLFLHNAIHLKRESDSPYSLYKRGISTHKFADPTLSITSHSTKGMLYNLLQWPRASVSINSNPRVNIEPQKSSAYWKQYNKKWSEIISFIQPNKSDSILQPNASLDIGPKISYQPNLQIKVHQRAHSVHTRKIPVMPISTINTRTIFSNELIDKKVSAQKRKMISGETQTDYVAKHKILPIHKVTIKINQRE